MSAAGLLIYPVTTFQLPPFMRNYKDICSAGYAVVLFCEYAFLNAKIPGIPSGQKMIDIPGMT